MALRVGDPSFTYLGQPGVVVPQKNKLNGKIDIDTDKERVKTEFRHGYLVGIEAKDVFNSIMDTVKKTEDPSEKVAFLSNKLEEYEAQNSTESQNFARYLKAELSHLMNTYHIKPRIYQLPPQKAQSTGGE